MQIRQGKLLELAESLYPEFSSLLWNMERRGVYVSTDELRRIEFEATRDSAAKAKELDAFSGQERNWNSRDEVAEFLYDQLGLPELPEEARSPKYWGKTRITAYEAVEYMYRHHPERRGELDTLRAFKRAGRARNYASDLLGRSVVCGQGLATVHPTYGTYNDNTAGRNRDKTGTSTGRLSVSNPPLQQIPRDKKKDPYRVRRAFVAPPGKRLVVVDLEQLEVRIQAHLHMKLFGDTTLRDLCEQGDFHGDIAIYVFSQIWPEWKSALTGERLVDIKGSEVKGHSDPFVPWCRDQEKAVMYGCGYGQKAKSFGSRLWTLAGDPIGEEVADKIMRGLFAKIPGIPKYQQWVRETVSNKGGIWSLLGKWRPLTRDNRGWRQGLNFPMQSGGAEIAVLWMLACQQYGLALQVHDEIHCVVDDDKADAAVEFIEAAALEVGEQMGLGCPIRAKGGHGLSWNDAK